MNRGHAFLQLILARVREFYREPEVLFWVYGFPLILATVLGIAFASSSPSPPSVDVEESPPSRAEQTNSVLIERSRHVQMVTLSSMEDSRTRSGRWAKPTWSSFPKRRGNNMSMIPTRDKSVLARYWVDSILARAELREARSKGGISLGCS